ncbi:Uncharacterised protein [Leclercia adecarboxylata]|uniref:Uncharacterized protein n=1 Tax=Leclercia adecarboxylata TaxID=83655 RepID=A0A4U9HXE8_9ENTR|nr:Uncharacterised protein [Leclercia adecarboxylata]
MERVSDNRVPFFLDCSSEDEKDDIVFSLNG